MTLSQYWQYLASKKSVDDRALNAGVLAWVIERLQRMVARVRVLEIGAGLGTTPARLHELGTLRNRKVRRRARLAAHPAARVLRAVDTAVRRVRVAQIDSHPRETIRRPRYDGAAIHERVANLRSI